VVADALSRHNSGKLLLAALCDVDIAAFVAISMPIFWLYDDLHKELEVDAMLRARHEAAGAGLHGLS